MEGSRPARRGAAGFTVMEVLIGIVVMSLVGVAVAAISMTGVLRISDGAVERQLDATTAQWVSMAFARDVAGAAGLSTTQCAPPEGSDRLVTLESSTGGFVTYHSRRTSISPARYDLSRRECPAGAADRTIVEDLEGVQPSATCDGGPCEDGDAPRSVRLEVTRTDRFAFELGGSRRTTDGNQAGGPLEAPDFLSLGGDTPLSVGGSSRLVIDGTAYVNAPDSGMVAVALNGSSGAPWRLSVTGDFAVQSGATCPNCATHADQLPGAFAQRLPDPLRFLPTPDVTDLPERTDCPVEGGVRVCRPGVYPVQFPPSGGGAGGVKDFVLEPGVYALDAGVKVTNGSITGDGVLLLNRSGAVSITGADLQLSPPTTGTYSGLLLFQPRSNTSEVRILGNAALASLTGTIYAPGSTGVVLGGGGGTLAVGRVVGGNLTLFGSGTVIVSG